MRLVGRGTGRPVVPPGRFQANPDSIDFGLRLLLSTTPRTVTISNSGGSAFSIGGLDILPSGGADFSGDYSLSADTCSGTNVAPGATCTLTITFRPTLRPIGEGPRPAVLVVDDTSPGNPHLIPVTGRSPLPRVLVTPAVGRGGSIAFVLGSSFPASLPALVQFKDPISLRDIDAAVTTATNSAGETQSPLLVLPRSLLGTRLVLVTVAGISASAPFLVEAGSVQVGDDAFLIRR